MIISHRKKFAFFANQKTGSKAVGLMLRMCGVFDERDILVAQPFPATRTAYITLPGYNLDGRMSNSIMHYTPTKAIEAGYVTLEQLREYDCYAFLRDPEARFFAARSALMTDRNGNPAMPGRRVAGIVPPQYEFFYVGDEQVVTPLDFDSFGQEIYNVIEKLGGKLDDIPEVNLQCPHLPKEVKFEKKQHTKDYTLYRRMKNEIQNSKT